MTTPSPSCAWRAARWRVSFEIWAFEAWLCMTADDLEEALLSIPEPTLLPPDPKQAWDLAIASCVAVIRAHEPLLRAAMIAEGDVENAATCIDNAAHDLPRNIAYGDLANRTFDDFA